MKTTITMAFLLLSLYCTSTVQAVTIYTVPVGNAGNTGELSGAGAGGDGPDAIVGVVAYDYWIGTNELLDELFATGGLVELL